MRGGGATKWYGRGVSQGLPLQKGVGVGCSHAEGGRHRMF